VLAHRGGTLGIESGALDRDGLVVVLVARICGYTLRGALSVASPPG
jgi:hypothetical protein